MKTAAFLALLLLAPFSGAGAEAEGLSLVDPLRDEPVRLELDAPVTHLVFFATWCPACLDELPRLAELEARWRGRGYRLVLVAVGTRHTLPRLRKFATERRPPGRFLFDSAGRAEARWRAGELPTHVLLDDSGGEVARAGFLGRELEQTLERLLAETP